MANNTRIMPRIRDNDWVGLRRTLNTLSKFSLGPESSPTFAGLILSGGLDLAELTLTGLTATRLMASDGSKLLSSVANLATWIAGTANRITVSNDGDGTITLSGPQDIHTGATPTFAGLTLSSIAAEGSDVDKFLVDSTGVIKFRTGAEVLADIGGSGLGHLHDGRYYTEAEIGSTTDGSSGASLVGIATGTGSPTIDQLQEYFDNTGSAGYFTGGELTDGGAGTLDVAAGEGFIRESADDNAPLLSFKWSASAGIAIPDNTTQYVFVDDAGTISLNASEFTEEVDKIMLGVVTDEGGAISHTFNLGVRLEESIGQMGRYIRQVDSVVRNRRKGGLLFGESGDANRFVTMTQGQLEWGRTSYPFAAFNTAGADTFDTYSIGGQEATGVSAWPNTQYDNAGTLTTMTNNRWAVLWWYLEPDGHIVLLYGRDQYVTEGQAEDELEPASSIPIRLSSASVIAAKFIFQKSEDTTARIETAFGTPFTSSGVTDHGNLAGLGDDDHAQYHTDARVATWLAANHETTFTHADIATNTTHRGSDGSDHSYLNQAVTIASTPTFAGLTIADGGTIGNAVIMEFNETLLQLNISNCALRTGGTPLTGNYGFLSANKAASTRTSRFAGFQISAGTEAAVFTLDDFMHVYTTSVDKGAGSIITHVSSFAAASSISSQGINSAGFYFGPVPTSYTGHWAFYGTGNAYFGGNVGVGGAPSTRFQVVDAGKITNGFNVATIRQDDANVSGLVIGNDAIDSRWYRGLKFSVDASSRGKIETYINGVYQDLLLNPIGGNVGIGIVPKTKLTVEGTLTLKEQAAADGDTAGYGQIFVKNTTPCQLWFRRDDGTEIRLDA